MPVKTKFSIAWVSLWMLLMSFATLSGQAYNLKRFDDQSGLNDQFVYTLIQDDKGFLYIGTGNGLYRFDGANFTLLTKESGLAENFVTSSYKDAAGRIWLGHYEGSISLLENNVARTILDSNRIKSSISAIQADSKGNIWCATQRGGIFLLDSTDTKPQAFTEGLEDRIVLSMGISRDDQILVGTEDGLVVLQQSKAGGKLQLRLNYFSTKIPSTKIQCIAKRNRRPGFFIGTEDAGLIEFLPSGSDENDGVRIFAEGPEFENINIQSILEDANEHVWLGLRGQGFKKYNDADVGNRMVPIVPRLSTDSIGDEIIRVIYPDKFGQVWMGTYGNGLLCLSDETFNRFRIIGDSIGKVQIVATMEDQRGDLWFATNAGVYVIDRSVVNSSDNNYTFDGLLLLPYKYRYTTSSGLPDNDISCIFQEESKRIWVGTRDKGVAYLDPNATTFETLSLNDLYSSNRIKSIVEDKKGMIWIATSDGAFTYNRKTDAVNAYSTRNGLSHNNIYHVFPDSKGRIWFSTHTNRISIFNGKSFDLLEVSEHGEVPNITAAVEDKEGNFWLGSDGHGLYIFDGKAFKQFTKADGLVSNYIYQIVIDRYQNIWTTHREGISRYIRETGKIISYPTKSFFPLEENPITSAKIDVYGNIWFSTEFGVLRYNWYPSRNKVDPPHIFIQGIKIGEESFANDAEISLPYQQYDAKFSFLGLTFVQQEAVRYQFRLLGRSPDWSELTDNTSAMFQDLEDGEYTFQVRACNYFGQCNDSPAKVTFLIAAPFWKTWWFRIFVVLAIVALVIGYFRYRLYRLRKEKHALEEKVRERTSELLLEKEKVEKANLELEKLSLVASETDNAVIILDKNLDMIWVNNGFSRLTGLELKDLISFKGTSNYLESSSNPNAKKLLQKALESNESVQYESELPSKNGNKIWVVSTLTPILDENKELRNVVIIDSNITERKANEERVRQMNAELESQVKVRTQELADANAQLNLENIEHIKTAEALQISNRELDTFVYRASHDLKGPLASMMGLVNIAGMELSDNEVAMRYLGLMDKASKRLDSILIDLIEATQVKQHIVEFMPINVVKFSEGIVEALSHIPNYGATKVDLNIDPELVINSDEKLLSSIIHNFLANAIRYRDPAKEKQLVALRVKLVDNEVQVEVEDNGIGIPDEVQHRVFDMFYRGTNQSGGSGLGLYIVKKAVEKLDGSLALKSKEGEGTTISARFPNQMVAEKGE